VLAAIERAASAHRGHRWLTRASPTWTTVPRIPAGSCTARRSRCPAGAGRGARRVPRHPPRRPGLPRPPGTLAA